MAPVNVSQFQQPTTVQVRRMQRSSDDPREQLSRGRFGTPGLYFDALTTKGSQLRSPLFDAGSDRREMIGRF